MWPAHALFVPTLCKQQKALARLRVGAGWPESLLLTYAMSLNRLCLLMYWPIWSVITVCHVMALIIVSEYNVQSMIQFTSCPKLFRNLRLSFAMRPFHHNVPFLCSYCA